MMDRMAATNRMIEHNTSMGLLRPIAITVNDDVMLCGAVWKGNALSFATITMVTTSSACQQLSPLSK